MKKRGMAAMAVLMGVRVQAAMLHVDLSSTHPVPPFDSWATAATNIQDAVDAAEAGDRVLVTNGSYRLSAPIVVNKDIAIESVGGDRNVVVDGQGWVRCFQLGNSSNIISGLTITNGFSSGEGGGIYCTGDNPVVTNCLITGCRSDSHGGGMRNGTIVDSALVANSAAEHAGGMRFGSARNCRFIANTAQWGGGMSWAQAVGCVFSNNATTQFGGGMCGEGGLAIDCFFVDNAATNSGGGMQSGTASNCTFLANTANHGGGMQHGDSFDCLFISNRAEWGAGVSWNQAMRCTFSNNVASSSGGGMSGAGSVAESCLFVGNFAEAQGGGIIEGSVTNALFFGNRTNGDGGAMKLADAVNCTFVSNSAAWWGGLSWGSATNCIVWGNLGGNLSDATDVGYSCSPDLMHGVDGNMTNTPSFADAASGDYRPAAGSPCIDAAVAVGVKFDRNGLPRPLDGDADGRRLPDMGAFEFASPLADADGDGLSDAVEEAHGLGLCHDDSRIMAYMEASITQSPAAYGLYTSDSIMDLSMGQLMLQASNGMMNLSLQLEQRSSLVDGGWTNVGAAVDWQAASEEGKGFFRIRAQKP